MLKHRFALLLVPLVAITSVALSGSALAGGFFLTEQSAASLGQAHAGGAAYADDASTIFYNAAGLTRLNKSSELLFSASAIRLGADFSKQSATDAIGQPLSGGDGGSVGKLGAVPAIYYSTPINDKLVFGIGFTVPFGLSTDYYNDSIFRYQAIYSSVLVSQLTPTIAYKVSNHFSIGLGIDYQHADVKLSNAIDYGAVCFGNADPVTCTAMGLTPQSHDGFFQVEGTSNKFGYNVGVLWDYDTIRFGIAYRNGINHDISGNATFTNVPALFSSMGLFQNGGASAKLDLPSVLSFSYFQQLNDTWSLMADYTHIGWNSFNEIRIHFANPNQPDAVKPENWQTTNRYSVGINYKYSDSWLLRAGIAYDESPVNSPNTQTIQQNASTATRDPRLPDANRRWIAFGATWFSSKHSQWDIGYAHLFLNHNIPINQVGPSNDRIVGTYNADADILGIDYRYSF